ncbi:MAG: hypothetical protein ACOC2W_01955 [bacterium]
MERIKVTIELGNSTTIDNSEVENVKKELTTMGIPFVIKDEARDIHNNILDDCSKLYLPNGDTDRFKIYDYINGKDVS